MRKLISLVLLGAFALAISPVNLLAVSEPAVPAAPGTPSAVLLVRAQDTGGVEGLAIDSGRQPLADVKVSLVDQRGVTVATQRTATNGAFSFTGVTPGTYSVRVLTTTVVSGVSTETVVGTVVVIVSAGMVATLTVTTTASRPIVAPIVASAGGAAAGGIFSTTTLLIAGAVAGAVAIIAVVHTASPST